MNKGPLINVSIVSVVVFIALGAYVLWYGVVKQLEGDAVTIQTQINEKEAERTHAASTRTTEEEVVAQENHIASHVVQTADIVLFLEGLEKTGKTLGAVVDVASVTSETKSADGRISLSLSITGSFDAVMRTLGAIEHGPYANMVSDLTLDTSDEGKSWSAKGVFIVATVSKKTTP